MMNLGLVIELKKNELFEITKPLSQNDSAYVFGYYDALQIKSVPKWLQYSPFYLNRNVKNRATASYYPIRLLFPSERCLENLSKSFNYSMWQKSNVFSKDCPCVSIILLNLTDEYKKFVREKKVESLSDIFQQERVLIDLGKHLIEICKSNNVDLSKINCCIMPSMGYSDFCLLTAGENWKDSLLLTESLHHLKVKETTPILSTDYYVPAYYGNLAEIKEKQFEDLELTISFNLNPHTTADALRELNPCFARAKINRTSGSTDIAIYTSKKEVAATLIQKINTDKNFQNVFIDIETTMGLSIPEINPIVIGTETKHPLLNKEPMAKSIQMSLSPNKMKLERQISNFEKAIKKYEKFLINNHRHKRQAVSLREMIRELENLCRQKHTESICEIMCLFLESFCYCLNQCIEQRKQNPNISWNDIETDTQNLCRRVSDFLSDLSRADTVFMERERYSHPSVSSATKLLLSFNQWLNRFILDIQKITSPDSSSLYSVLIISGGCDQTQTYRAFSFLSPILDKKTERVCEKVPFIIQMSEMSLFDFSGSILRAVHECLHFSGNRYRDRRVEFFFEFIARFYATKFAKALFTKEPYVKPAIQQIEKYLQVQQLEEAENIEEYIDSMYKKLYDWLVCEIYTILLEELKMRWDATVHEEQEFFLEALVDWVFTELKRFFLETPEVREARSAENGLFPQKLYWLRAEVREKFFMACNQFCRNHKIAAVFFSVREKEIHAHSLPYENDWNFIVQMLNRVFMPFTDTSKAEQEEIYVLDWISKNNALNVLESVADCFSECFSDVIACEILDVQVDDYIMMHLYEDWDLSDALVESYANIIRFYSVLYCCFPESLIETGDKLSEGTRQIVSQCVQRLERNGLTRGRFNSTEICNKLDNLLEKSLSENFVIQPLINYLKSCMDEYKKFLNDGHMCSYKDIFKKLRMPDYPASREEEYKGKIDAMFYSLHI